MTLISRIVKHDMAGVQGGWKSVAFGYETKH